MGQEGWVAWVGRKIEYLGAPGALVPFIFWVGGFPYYNRLQEEVGTLILTSLLKDLDGAPKIGYGSVRIGHGSPE